MSRLVIQDHGVFSPFLRALSRAQGLLTPGLDISGTLSSTRVKTSSRLHG